MWQVIGELTGSGGTVFLTTQYLEEADRLADRIAVVDGGRVVAEGTPAELKKQVADQRLDLMLASPAFFAGLARKLGARAIHLDRGRRTIGVATDGSAAHVRARGLRRLAGRASLPAGVAGARCGPADRRPSFMNPVRCARRAMGYLIPPQALR